MRNNFYYRELCTGSPRYFTVLLYDIFFFFKVIDELRFRIFENCTSKEIDHNFYYILPNRTKPGTARTVLIETALAGDSLYL